MSIYDTAMRLAIHQARAYLGATSPNPPVGAVGLDSQGNVLSVQAHQRAGLPHAEALVIEDCQQRGILSRLHTLVVTLEPCNHQGRTPPCTDKILATSIKKVIYGSVDPNPKVQGGGIVRLKSEKIEVVQHTTALSECEELIEAFAHWIQTGLPWVTVKQAINSKGTMIPENGKKTFTSEASLRYAHELRKRADAILTGSGTIIADNPEFTVRHVQDHPNKKRFLVYMDRRGRVPESWVKAAEERGFSVHKGKDLETILQYLGKNNVLEVLVEAGPTLSSAILSTPLWNSHVVITQGEGPPGQTQDRIDVHRNRGKTWSGRQSGEG